MAAQQSLSGKREEQLEAVRVALTAQRAIAALVWHVLSQELGDQWGDRCHAISPATSASPPQRYRR